MGKKASILIDINYKRLTEQDKDFNKFLESIALLMVKDFDEAMLKNFYAVYQAGISPEQVAIMLRANK